MVTYLAALRFAANIEAELIKLQTRRFRRTEDISALALPPLIPLGQCGASLREPDLDRIRKRFKVTVCTAAVDETVEPPPVVETSRITVEQTRTLARALAEIGGELFIPWDPLGGITLGWEGSERGTSPIPLPITAALWLTVLELHPAEGGSGDAHPWWDGVRWWELFSRRLTVRD